MLFSTLIFILIINNKFYIINKNFIIIDKFRFNY